MTLTARILKELERNGPATSSEMAAILNVPMKSVSGLMSNMVPRLVIVVDEKPYVGVRGGRLQNVYGLPGTHVAPKPEKRAISNPIANGEYAIAGRITIPQFRGYYGGSSRRGSES